MTGLGRVVVVGHGSNWRGAEAATGDPARIFAAVAELVAASEPGGTGFGEALVMLFRTLVRLDHVVVFAYLGDARPVDLHHTFDCCEHEVFVAKYQDGPYLLDPFYRAAREGRTGLRRMRDLAPDRFFSSEYFRSYYVETGLAEEVGYFCPLADGAAVVVSLMRRHGSGVFARREIAALEAVEPLVTMLVRRRHADVAARFPRWSASGRRRRGVNEPSARSIWRGLNLTAREAAVVDLVLQGHSSDSVARLLGIATGTVKVHRRNVYRKLNIASQTQLLSIYLDRATRALSG